MEFLVDSLKRNPKAAYADLKAKAFKRDQARDARWSRREEPHAYGRSKPRRVWAATRQQRLSSSH